MLEFALSMISETRRRGKLNSPRYSCTTIWLVVSPRCSATTTSCIVAVRRSKAGHTDLVCVGRKRVVRPTSRIHFWELPFKGRLLCNLTLSLSCLDRVRKPITRTASGNRLSNRCHVSPWKYQKRISKVWKLDLTKSC